jgi:hypothetical protein
MPKPRREALKARPVVQPQHSVAGEQVPDVVAVVEQVVRDHLHRHRLRDPAQARPSVRDLPVQRVPDQVDQQYGRGSRIDDPGQVGFQYRVRAALDG